MSKEKLTNKVGQEIAKIQTQKQLVKYFAMVIENLQPLWTNIFSSFHLPQPTQFLEIWFSICVNGSCTICDKCFPSPLCCSIIQSKFPLLLLLLNVANLRDGSLNFNRRKSSLKLFCLCRMIKGNGKLKIYGPLTVILSSRTKLYTFYSTYESASGLTTNKILS